ncbi:MAG: hypothetical protein HYR85_15695 [Planctomycetes bacterium]|nr:hypothetical protein [Planctomycetota bacterium]
MTSRLAAFLFVLLTGRSLLFAQTVIQTPDGQTIIVDGGEGEQPPQAQPVPDGQPAPNADAKPTPRQQKLQQLTFDRRPSAILKAWSNPPKPKEAEPDSALPPPAVVEAVVPSPYDVPENPEAVKKKAEAEAAQKKAAEEAAKKAAEAKAIDEEMVALQRAVTLGDWKGVKTYFAELTPAEGKTGYERLLQVLKMPPPPQQPTPGQPPPPQQGQQQGEKNRFAAEDVIGLCSAAPLPLEKAHTTSLGQILRLALDAGVQLDGFLETVRPGVDSIDSPLIRRKLARLLLAANEVTAMGEFLPTPDEAEQANDREGLNLLSHCYLAQNQKDGKVEWLEKAWKVTQAALADGEIADDEKADALTRAVEIAPRIRKELGATWLNESFTSRPERGMEILASIGTFAALGLQREPMASDRRQKWLELQSTAAKALLASAPERANEWHSTLELLAMNWMREALFTYQWDTSTSLNPRMQRDPYGNFFYWDPGQYNQRAQNMPLAIKTSDVLDVRPDDAWLSHIEAALRPKFDIVTAQLYLKVGEDEAAFPFIEKLASSHPKPAKDLVDEFLRVWAKNHDPNSERNRSNQYVFFYGFEERASGIPLTRSKQDRNLKDLGECVTRLRKLPVELDEKLLAQAFTKAHSVAEVYKLESIEQVFGPLKALSASSVAELVQGMRANLAGMWRDPALQEKSKTKRRAQDIVMEVLRGYELAHATLDRALAGHPDSWELVLADAAIRHDEINYAQEIQKHPEFSQVRSDVFQLFHKAAAMYAAKATDLPQEKETTQVYETWFYAALGACDLAALTHEQLLAEKEIPLIREAIAALPGEKAERHMGMFANTLFTRLGSVKPAVKVRLVREGLAIVGDHKQAREARQVFDYYNDLVTEIKLETRIDGGDRVGYETPFGLFVDLKHTREIERESGGFAKYLQNQNSQQYGWNYGRPLEDYRDKFEEAARTALSEQFDVMSVTFNEPTVKSRAVEPYGWRVTPYAYVLLKAKGPQVDRVPPLHLDLDFLDTSGYAVLPVESAIVPIDATAKAGEVRPCENLKITQTLDERHAKDQKVLLEVKATGRGLVPPLADYLDVVPDGFEIAKKDEAPPSVVKFDDEDDQGRVISERVTTLTFVAKAGLSKLPDSFAFGKPKVEVAGSDHFRYVDADLASVGDSVLLEHTYGAKSRAWMWWIPIGVVALGAAAFAVHKLRRPRANAKARFPMPVTLTPFTVLGYLRDIQRNDGLAQAEREQLAIEITRLERFYFATPEGSQPDLANIAATWSGRASGGA